MLAFGSGARLGELLALPWGPDGLDLDAGVLRVRRGVDRVRGADGLYPFIAPKSRDSRREIPLAPEDVALLRRHRLATGRPADGALVFPNEESEALSPLPRNGRSSGPQRPRTSPSLSLASTTPAMPLRATLSRRDSQPTR